jgi:serine/threonine protein kinase
MFDVRFKSFKVSDPMLARSEAMRKLKDGIRANERIDLVRTAKGHKVSRRSVFFGKGGVTLEAKKFLHALDLYAEKKEEPIGHARSLEILDENVKEATKKEQDGLFWKSKEEIFIPCGFVAGKPEWKVMQKAGQGAGLFVMLDAPDGQVSGKMRRTLRNLTNRKASWRGMEEFRSGGVAKILVPLRKSKVIDFPSYVCDVRESHIKFKGERFDFEEEAIGKVGGSDQRLIRKAVSQRGDSIVLKPVSRLDAPEMAISEKVGSSGASNILGCRGSIENPDVEGGFFLVSDYAKDGTVSKYIDKLQADFYGGQISRRDLTRKFLDIARQMCLGIQQLHELGYKHLDVKPDNFYVEEDQSGDFIVKLADFGASAKKDVLINSARTDCIKYMSPEMWKVFSHRENRSKVDDVPRLKELEKELMRRGEIQQAEARQNARITLRSLDKDLTPVGVESDVYGLVASLWDICRQDEEERSVFEPMKFNDQKSWLGKREKKLVVDAIRDGFNDDWKNRPTAQMLAERFAKLIEGFDKT